MTVAPQKDICPQGKTYPKKAVPITKTNMILPVNHTIKSLKEPKKNPLEQCESKDK